METMEGLSNIVLERGFVLWLGDLGEGSRKWGSAHSKLDAIRKWWQFYDWAS